MNKLVFFEESLDESNDRHFVTSLARGLEVLSCFTVKEAELGNQEISNKTSLPKSTVSRFTNTLCKLGYLEYIKHNSKYRLGIKSAAFGASALNSFNIKAISSGLMQNLADLSKGSVSLGIRQKLSITYLANKKGESNFSLNVSTGWKVPIVSTAIGRAYIAGCSVEEKIFLLSSIKEDDPINWEKNKRIIEESEYEYKKLNYCKSYGDWQSDVNSIATVIHREDGLPPVVINCGGPSFLLTPEYMEKDVAPKLIETAKKIEYLLKYKDID
jgi:DNA-binding IclR family transcriptional regulator